MKQDSDDSQDHSSRTKGGALEESVPFLPDWISIGGWILLAAIGVALLVLSVDAGTSYGAPDGWGLVLAPVVLSAAWLWTSFTRRVEELELRKRLDLQSSLKIEEIDRLNWQEFEGY